MEFPVNMIFLNENVRKEHRGVLNISGDEDNRSAVWQGRKKMFGDKITVHVAPESFEAILPYESFTSLKTSSLDAETVDHTPVRLTSDRAYLLIVKTWAE
jgi:hypothetical protein